MYQRHRKVQVALTPEALVHKYWPREYAQMLVESSNRYREMKRKQFPYNKYWNSPSVSADFTLSSMYVFLCILYYMGVVCLPAKHNYWLQHKSLPIHPLIKNSTALPEVQSKKTETKQKRKARKMKKLKWSLLLYHQFRWLKSEQIL